MSSTTQPIKNIMAYLRTTILNGPHHDGALLSGAGQLADRTESEEVSAVFHKERNAC